ncbi:MULTISPECIES: iron-containing alcohol dehydrogenase [unclassified Moritella]|uniref:iron-containing alcohol dehydrogenase n=1 Tax=unclassified Moritella TaxID=2637987 RepID=UPI001BA794ED|nr:MULTISPECIES: iron-containing alcohol dehydrogenase [unclassified Moritella]QUM86128.1 iron-containing alcohol dehydrogenase [Moritella sp. 28]QUM90364.1 iron-containing alcohol dehydrogenase [Moritella sp. 36]
MSSQVILPRIMQIGAGASKDIVNVLNNLGVSKPLIITDKMMVKLGYAAQIKNALALSNLAAEIFDDTVPEPTVASIQNGINKAKSGDFDCLIALGGGSPIDSAKAISVLSQFGGEMRDYKVPRVVSEQGLPLIAIPTTAGTGTECTCFTIITDEKNDEKMLCAGVGFMPVAALVDFELTLSLPARITADTGIDALTHAIEAYVSRKSNTFSDSQAISAMKLIAPNLRKTYHDGNDKTARENIMLGSTLAGMAFSNASVALVHGMSRPIGAAFHVPHGLSNAMLLPAVTAFSIPAAPERYANCAKAMGIASETDSTDVANEKLILELKALNVELNVPTPAEFGIEGAKYFDLLPTMAKQALASGSPNNNPRVPSIDEMIAIYKEIWVD